MLDFIYDIYTYSGVALFVNLIFLTMMASLFPRKTWIHPFSYYVSPIIIYWAIYFYPQYALHHETIPYFYYFSVIMVINLVWILLFLDGANSQKLIYYLYFFTVYKCIVFFLGAFIYDYKKIIDHELYMLLDMGSSLIPVVSLWHLNKFFRAHPLSSVAKNLNRKQLLLMAYCPLSIFITFQMADPSINFDKDYFVSISAFLLIFNLPVFYYLFTKIGENNEAQVRLGRALAETNAQVARYRYTILIEEQARKERHELKNKYFYIQTLLKEGKLDKLNAFLTDHLGELSHDDSGIYSHNVLIDHVLHTKLDAANHGLGINIVKRAVRNSNGIFDLAVESNYFVATVMVPLE